VASCRFTCYHQKKTKSQDKVKLMDNLRSEVNDADINENGRKAFPYSSQYLQFEQYKAIEQEAAQNLGLCMLAVSLVVFLLIVNPVASMFVVLSVGTPPDPLCCAHTAQAQRSMPAARSPPWLRPHHMNSLLDHKA